MEWVQEDFDRFVLGNEIIGFFDKPIKLKSGRMSNWYANWRTFTNYVSQIDPLADFVIDFTKHLGLEPNCFYGVPEGATKLGIITQYKWGKQGNSNILPMGRGKPKEHGALIDKYFVGEPEGKTIILEDVTTTGGSLIKEIEKLQSIYVNVIAAFGLTHRNQKRDDGLTVKEAVGKFNVNYYAMSNAVDLLPRIPCYDKIAKSVEKEFEEYGEVELKMRGNQ